MLSAFPSRGSRPYTDGRIAGRYPWSASASKHPTMTQGAAIRSQRKAATSSYAAATSTRVSLKQAPSAMSARSSAETNAEIVCPVRLVDSQAPFSLATTPRGTLSVICNGRITSPRSFHP